MKEKGKCLVIVTDFFVESLEEEEIEDETEVEEEEGIFWLLLTHFVRRGKVCFEFLTSSSSLSTAPSFPPPVDLDRLGGKASLR